MPVGSKTANGRVRCCGHTNACFPGYRRYYEGVVRETLSKVAVAKEDVVRLLTAKPRETLGAMLSVWLVPNGVQFTPVVERYMLNTFPLLTSLIQYGSVALLRLVGTARGPCRFRSAARAARQGGR